MEAMVKSDNKDQRLLGGRERAEEGKLVTTRQRGTLWEKRSIGYSSWLCRAPINYILTYICSFYVCV